MILKSKITFQYIIMNEDGISFRVSPEIELFIGRFSSVSHCEASISDMTTMKLRLDNKDIRVSFTDIQVRDVTIMLINKFCKKAQRAQKILHKQIPSLLIFNSPNIRKIERSY